jgi:hypothetical protein
VRPDRKVRPENADIEDSVTPLPRCSYSAVRDYWKVLEVPYNPFFAFGRVSK